MKTYKTGWWVACTGVLLLAAAAEFPHAAATSPAPTASASAPAPSAVATIDNSAVLNFKSAINGNDYQVFVFLPKDYAKSTTRYPVLYLLDGNAWQAAYGALQRLTMGGEMPQIILVGIGYQGPSMRSTDYPTVANSYWNVPRDRGAPVFLRVLKEEIIPRVESNYRIDPADRALGGHSMGGYFTLFTLFASPETFQRYWISSPSIVWDHFVIFQHERAYAKTHKNLAARVFVDVGELESDDSIEQLQSLERTVTGHGYPDLSWSTQVEPDLPHIAVPNVALVYALYYLYGRPVVPVAAARLASLVGMYKLPDQTTFSLTTDGKSLFVNDFHSKVIDVEPAITRLRLLAESPDTFYARYIGLNFKVLPAAGSHPVRLEVSQKLSDDQDPSKAAPAVIAEPVSK